MTKRFKPSQYLPVINSVSTERGHEVSVVLGDSRAKDVVETRKIIAIRLRNMGMPRPQIGRALNRELSTIDYYVYPSRQARQQRYEEARRQTRSPRTPRPVGTIRCSFPPSVRTWIEHQAKIEQVTPECIVRDHMRVLAESSTGASA